MKEIKFRGKQAHGTGAGRWLYGYLIVITDEEAVKEGYGAKIGGDSDYPIYVDVKTVGQFIGVISKDGNDIYAGDIVTCLLSFEGGTLPHMGEIVYVDKFASFATKNQAGETLLYNHLRDSYEVVGNIFDNPELLND